MAALEGSVVCYASGTAAPKNPSGPGLGESSPADCECSPTSSDLWKWSTDTLTTCSYSNFNSIIKQGIILPRKAKPSFRKHKHPHCIRSDTKGRSSNLMFPYVFYPLCG